MVIIRYHETFLILSYLLSNRPTVSSSSKLFKNCLTSNSYCRKTSYSKFEFVARYRSSCLHTKNEPTAFFNISKYISLFEDPAACLPRSKRVRNVLESFSG